ncbi:alpha-1,3-glucanase (glycoside hydrolase family 71) domain protein [Metarhizium robertsii]|uniref:Alpha-1,3-glucanase (Glycoside hydrolase family 71) domain protein n=1 Tax=Metarhizium robertsii TaxID=568076 RepID=A0A0A1UQY5_9HYPO|nr:alpha-1,3-glucanase (glycoside hydrolase family 71) domain protein [Metarhizium robertsii]
MFSLSSALRRLGVGWLAIAACLSVSKASLMPETSPLEIGIVGDRTSASDYDDDMRRAKDAGIDAFALNIGVDGYTDQQLGYAYDSAARNGMKVFISFDFNWWSPGDAGGVGRKIAQYASKPAQLVVDGRVFASSFAGDGLDVDAMRSAAGSNVYFVPNFHPGQSSPDKIDGALNWMGWDSNGNNKAPSNGHTVTVADGDNSYQSWLGTKKYMAPVSPWFFTHFGPEVSYSKNWVFPGGSLIFDRWNQVLQKRFPMLEIVTWNDYGESHYVGPLKSPHYDDGNSKWVNDMPHDGWLDLSKPFIAAYKAGASSINDYIKKDKIIYWYRRTLRTLDCDSTDTTAGRPANNNSGNYFMGRPDGWQTMDDVVYVVSFLTQPGTITVQSGGQSKTKNAPSGAHIFTVPAGVGQQKFSLTRSGNTVLSGTSLMDIANVCPCGIYNFNAYVGTLPSGFNDPLQPHGLASLTVGLHVSTCEAKPSLGTNPPVTNPPGGETPTTTTSPGGQRPTTTTSSTKPPVTSPPGGGEVCTGGTNADGESGNYSGLCGFSCHYGYCPPGPCKCTSFGSQISPPPETGYNGCPLPGEGEGYKGLCSFSCSHGYCPGTACQRC